MKKVFERDISFRVLIILCVLAAAFKLLLSYMQLCYVTPPLAPLDDHLMFKAAVSISKGEWLGAYSNITTAKHMFFSIWLAFLHSIKTPYLVGGMALWLCSSATATAAFRPVLKKNYLLLLLFLFLAFNPAASAQFTLRIYRDNIFPAICLLFISGVIGYALRYNKPLKYSAGFLVVSGVAFGGAYLTREDGIWLVPFAIAAFLITTLFIFCNKQEKNKPLKIAIMLAPYIISAAMLYSYASMNERFYGRFVISDFSSGEFSQAIGLLSSIKQEKFTDKVAIPSEVRYKVYAVSPAFAKLEQLIEKNESFRNGYVYKHKDDYQAGSFYWALRMAAADFGEYKTPQTAREYWNTVNGEIKTAIDKGQLVSNGKNAGLTPPIRKEYILPVLAETVHSLWVTTRFEQCTPRTKLSVGTTAEIKPVEEFIYDHGTTVASENSDIPYFTAKTQIAFSILDFVNFIYAEAIYQFLLIAIIFQILFFIKWIKQKAPLNSEALLQIILFGLLMMSIFRAAMIAFVEVSSFGIGTYVMYLSTVHPMLIIYGFFGLVSFIRLLCCFEYKKQDNAPV